MRAKFFHRQFPDRFISTSKIRKIYKQHGIKLKQVRQDKYPAKLTLQSYFIELQKLRRAVHHAHTNGLPIIYTDEVVFTSLTYHRTSYSRKFKPHLVDQEDLNT